MAPRIVAKKFSIGGFAVMREALHLFGGAWHCKINQNSTYSVSRFNLGVLGALCRGLSPPWRRDWWLPGSSGYVYSPVES